MRRWSIPGGEDFEPVYRNSSTKPHEKFEYLLLYSDNSGIESQQRLGDILRADHTSSLDWQENILKTTDILSLDTCNIFGLSDI